MRALLILVALLALAGCSEHERPHAAVCAALPYLEACAAVPEEPASAAEPASAPASAAVPAPVPTPAPAPVAAPIINTPQTSAQQPPSVALPYRSELTRTARAVWGLDAPVPVFGAQIHQESSWRPDAVSPVGALGMAQFMPATARWIATIDPELVEGQPYNPSWAMRAMVVYDRNLYGQAPARYTPRDRMWVALRGYNGGIGHWINEAKATGLAAPTREQVDAACGKATRSAKHCAENLGYPQRILVVLQPRYAAWGPTL